VTVHVPKSVGKECALAFTHVLNRK
jgi:hypothetical protein